MTDAGPAAVARILSAARCPDPEATALAVIAALRGHGWRPTPAIRPPGVPPRRAGDEPPPEWHAARAALTPRDHP